MQREDTEPWYRQFWPWFIIALPASAVVAGLTTVWIAMQSNDSLVIDSSEGVNVVTERNIAAERAATRQNISATVSIASPSNAVTVALEAAAGTAMPQTLDLSMQHPTIAARDLDVVLYRAPAGADGKPTWTGHFLRMPSGRHQLILSSADQWRLSTTWNGEGRIRLVPAGAPVDDSD